MEVLRDLSSCEDIIIQKAGKGNFVVILNKSAHLKIMRKILSDIDKLKKNECKIRKET